ncbi:MAG: DUF2286 domain-containing protein [Acidilobaceae archaeon]|nr:DUF2286 domain-containing protein [Acidilobaceae archaeon]MCX8166019.1 DUF2286 domain-containing protein [Acidilobaceae archaeon]MDW7974660.1 DUF2286 domain-containing protein [Sulfolobales archaeon]
MNEIASLLIVRAERGKVVESQVSDGDLNSIVKAYVIKAAEEWDPARSDFIALRDEREVEVDDVDVAALKELERAGGRWTRTRGSFKIVFPLYTISFDNAMLSEKEYVENKIYLIAPYINEGLKEQLELEAAEITSPPDKAGGIRELD